MAATCLTTISIVFFATPSHTPHDRRCRCTHLVHMDIAIAAPLRQAAFPVAKVFSRANRPAAPPMTRRLHTTRLVVARWSRGSRAAVLRGRSTQELWLSTSDSKAHVTEFSVWNNFISISDQKGMGGNCCPRYRGYAHVRCQRRLSGPLPKMGTSWFGRCSRLGDSDSQPGHRDGRAPPLWREKLPHQVRARARGSLPERRCAWRLMDPVASQAVEVRVHHIEPSRWRNTLEPMSWNQRKIHTRNTRYGAKHIDEWTLARCEQNCAPQRFLHAHHAFTAVEDCHTAHPSAGTRERANPESNGLANLPRVHLRSANSLTTQFF